MKFTFKPFKSQKEFPTDPGTAAETQTPYQRRREQVRRAQKTHRERKEAYTKSLETEVIQLRANEARLFQETRALYAEISAMKNLLASHGIPYSSGLQHSPADVEVEQRSEGTFELSIQENIGKDEHKRIRIRRKPRQRSYGGVDKATSSTDYPSPPQSSTMLPPLETPAHSSTSTLVSNLDPTAIGMDFILSLEAPCLAHIPIVQDSQTLSEPSGHALLASATLLHHHHHHLSTTTTGASSPTWSVPESGIQRLLVLSSSIPLDGEIMPVQAWDFIRKHPQFGVLECARLEKLKATLLLHVKCYGFGGVVPQDVFENAVLEAFIDEPGF